MTSLRIILSSFAVFGLVLAPVVHAEERDNAREAVINLEAYAHYKMGKYEEARKIWEDLAAKGNTTAMINLANLFQQGQGVTEDQKRAMAYTAQAAELGDARAQYDLGLAYEKGHVVGRDIALAGAWFKKSADQNFSDAQFAYGVWLATGRGKGIENSTKEDLTEALEWLMKAEAAGNLEAKDYIKVLKGKAG